jgi:AraC family transcriptional regulator of adaptative response/methylated-DNA-[protein]-cysteine methyltransferase
MKTRSYPMNPTTSAHVSRPSRMAGRERETVHYAIGASAIGDVLVARSETGVCAILLGGGRDELIAELEARFPKAACVEGGGHAEADLARVVPFIESPADGLDLKLDMRGTAFQRRVWNALRDIPAGSTMSYAALASRVGIASGARAVAAACAANPLALAIPCHRVVRGNGDLAGYRWGVERKRQLLLKEAAA